MRQRKDRGFFNGIFLGTMLSLIVGLLATYLLTTLGFLSVSILEVPRVQVLLAWSQRNLGLSILPFSITLGLYFHSLPP